MWLTWLRSFRRRCGCFRSPQPSRSSPVALATPWQRPPKQPIRWTTSFWNGLEFVLMAQAGRPNALMLFQAELITICQPLGRFIVTNVLKLTNVFFSFALGQDQLPGTPTYTRTHTHTHIIHKHKRKPAQCKPAHFKQFTANYLAYYSYCSLLMLSSHFDSVFAAVFDTFSTLTIM